MPTTSGPRLARRPFLARLGAILAAPFAAAGMARAAEPGESPAEAALPGVPMTAFIGQIALMPYEFVPRGWALCNGQELMISEHNALFSLIGTNFGGDGRRTLRVPSLKPPYRGVRYMICTDLGTYPSRS